MAVERVLIFGKAPAAGRVKTRLTPPLPPDEAASVYEAMLRDVVSVCARERARVELWYDADTRAELYFATEFPNLIATPQNGADLGARMAHAFDASFADGAHHVIIIGSDVPTIPEQVLHGAIDDVRETDCVIGPTIDGGYYLIGINRNAWPRARTLFEEVAWSTDGVLRATVVKATAAKLELRVLPGWYDVDNIEDLRQALLDAQDDSNLARWGARPESVQFLNAG